MSTPASVIIACYNHADVLRLSLAALVRQRQGGFEVVIADDGSPEDLRGVLREWAPRFALGIQHVSHEDRGFRKTRILNRAIAVTASERLVFLDGDCLAHEDFVGDHLRYLAGGTVVTGRRVDVERRALPEAEGILARGLGLGPARLLGLRLRGRARRIEHGIPTRLFAEAPRGGIWGSNFSACKGDLVAVNGFNEEYESPGVGEDTDLDFRLRLLGVRVRVFRNRMVQYHVDHPRRSYDAPANAAILHRTMESRSPRARLGLAEVERGDFVHARYL